MRVLKAVVNEGVPVVQLAEVVDAFWEMPAAATYVDCGEAIRYRLRQALPNNRAGIRYRKLSSMHETAVAAAISVTGEEGALKLEPAVAHTIVADVKQALNGESAIVLVCEPRTRRYVFKLLEFEMDNICVLSARELLKPNGPVFDGIVGPEPAAASSVAGAGAA